MKKKYAICIYGEMRGIKSTIKNFYKNLVNKLDADIFILGQKISEEIDNNIDFYTENVKIKKLYEKENIQEHFNLSKINLINDGSFVNSTFNVIINIKNICDNYSDILEQNYDYIILTRSDYQYLYEFPNVIELSNENDIFWFYDDHSWGGVNSTMSFVPSKLIKKYLFYFYEYLTNNNILNKMIKQRPNFNSERFVKYILDSNNWKYGFINNNGYISADSLNDRTTWSVICYSNDYEVYYKYPEQFNNSYNNLKKFTKWNYENNNGFKIYIT